DVEPLPRGVPGGDDPVGDHLHRLIERQFLPSGAVGAAVLDLELAQAAVDELFAGRSLGAEAAAGDGAGRIALDLGDLLVLDVDELTAAHGAVGADRADHAAGGLGPGRQRLGVRRLGGPSHTKPA